MLSHMYQKDKDKKFRKQFDWLPYLEQIANLPVGIGMTTKEVAKKLELPRNVSLSRLSTILFVARNKGWFSVGAEKAKGNTNVHYRTGAFTKQELHEALTVHSIAISARYTGKKYPKSQRVAEAVNTEPVVAGTMVSMHDQLKNIRAELDKLEREMKVFQEKVVG